MKILSLEVRNIRGVPYFRHDFQSENAVIVGANGTGKSSILDALDFLLTGNITRLQGEGTGSITLSKYGPHVNITAKPEFGYVVASVGLPGYQQPVTVERHISEPQTLVYVNCDEGVLDESERLARHGLHMLTRQQMLKFIAASPSNRAAQIRALLNLDSIEGIRKNLASVSRKLDLEGSRAIREVDNAQRGLASILGIDTYESTAIQNLLNESRRKLGADLLETVSSDTVRSGIKLAASAEDVSVNPTLLLERSTKILQLTNESNLWLSADKEQHLRAVLAKLQGDPALKRALTQQKLVVLGISLAEEDLCPLCDLPWKNEDLIAHLNHKIAQAAYASQILEDITNTENALCGSLTDVSTNLHHLVAAHEFMLEAQQNELRGWQNDLETVSKTLQQSLETYSLDALPPNHVTELLGAESFRVIIQEVVNSLKKRMEADNGSESAEQVAFARLVQAESALKQLETCEAANELYGRVCKRAASLSRHYTEARDEVVGEIYESISDDFVSLYRQLHADENSFTANLRLHNAGLNLDVEFYGRGMFPPNALHSEGHQDSMGLCMFLALSNHLSGDSLQAMILDDVVTSLDTGHRRQLARLLAQRFENRQLILTTHDSVWSEQLRKEEFAAKRNFIELLNWTIDEGTIYRELNDIWDLVASDLDTNQANAAGAKLRNWAESFSKHLCHNFKAPVPFNIDGKYTLSDVLGPAKSNFRKYLNKAKNKANDNGNAEIFDRIKTVLHKLEAVYIRIDKEAWVANWASHDNPSGNLTSDEVAHVVSAFKDFEDLTRCLKCRGYLELTGRREVITCKCGVVSWKV